MQPATPAPAPANGLFVYESDSVPVQESPLSAPGVGQPAGQIEPAVPQGAPVEEGTAAAPDPAAPWEPAVLPEHMRPEDAYGAAKYFQSRYDQARAESERLRTEQAQAGQYADISRMLVQDPELLGILADRVRSRQSGQVSQAQAPGAPATPPPAFSAIPPPPADILSDEGEAWMKKFGTSVPAAFAQQQAELEALRGQIGQFQQFQQQQAQQSQYEGAIQEAMYQHGLSRVEATDFVRAAAEGRLYTDPAIAVQAWRLAQRPSAQAVRTQQAQQIAQQRQQQRTPQMAIAGAGQAGAPPTNGHQLFVTEAGGFDPFAPRR